MNTHVEVVFWDVQHGHAIYIKTPNEKNIVVDLGTGSYNNNNSEFSILKHLYYKFKYRTIDLLVITHPHRDHIDDIQNLDLFEINHFIRPKHLLKKDILRANILSSKKPLFQKYLDLDKKHVNPLKTQNNYFNYYKKSYYEMDIKFFSPYNCSTSNLNNQSIITVLEYANTKIVIPGDNEKNSYDELLNSIIFQNTINNADVLLASHHGRDSGFHENFIDIIKPKLSIISDNKKVTTNVREKYTKKSSSWKVKNRNTNIIKERKVLTTYNDGVINIKFGNDGKNDYLEVRHD